MSKRKGGRVSIAVSHRGEIAVHEGFVTCKEARKLEAGRSEEHV